MRTEGRNIKPDTEALTAFLGVYLREQDLARLDFLAKAAAVSRSTLVRRLLAQALDAQVEK